MFHETARGDDDVDAKRSRPSIGKPANVPREERTRVFVWDRSADHIRARSHNGCIQRPDTWLHPNDSRKRQNLFPCTAGAGAVHTCAGFRPPARRPFHTHLRPAAEKRQGTKSREMGERRCRGHYGDLEVRLSRMMPGRDEGCGRFARSRGSEDRAARPRCMRNKTIAMRAGAN
jgi:hypothetical protein